MGDAEASEEVNVVIQAGDCALTVMPYLGGKIASITVGDKELLQAPLMDYAPRTHTMSFDAADASGWDECLPSVAACRVETDIGLARIPDHGDLWRVPWVETGAPSGDGATLTLRGECFSLPLALQRTLRLSETPGGWLIELAYTLSNTGSVAAPWSWAAHPLFAVEAGDRIVLPASVHSLRVEGSGRRRLGDGGMAVEWPHAQQAIGGRTDLSIVQGDASKIGDKLFTGPLGAQENWAVLERPSAGLRIRVGFDPAATPYLGLWICYGGWPERFEPDEPGAKQMCVALEPATAPVDSLAVHGPWSRTLQPGATAAWTMTVGIESV